MLEKLQHVSGYLSEGISKALVVIKIPGLNCLVNVQVNTEAKNVGLL